MPENDTSDGRRAENFLHRADGELGEPGAGERPGGLAHRAGVDRRRAVPVAVLPAGAAPRAAPDAARGLHLRAVRGGEDRDRGEPGPHLGAGQPGSAHPPHRRRPPPGPGGGDAGAPGARPASPSSWSGDAELREVGAPLQGQPAGGDPLGPRRRGADAAAGQPADEGAAPGGARGTSTRCTWISRRRCRSPTRRSSGTLSDGVVLVVRANATAGKHVHQALEHLAGASVVGCVLNGAAAANTPYLKTDMR